MKPIVEAVELELITTNAYICSSQSYPTNLFPMGTIIRKQFNNRIFHEGAIVLYEPINHYHRVKCKNGDREEYMYEEKQ